jgi:hypothetical protein
MKNPNLQYVSMTFSLPLFIDVRPSALHALLSCVRGTKAFSREGVDVRVAVAEMEQLVRERQPADPALVSAIFKRELEPSLEAIFRPGVTEVSVEEISVLLAYAKGEQDHTGWCFSARDDEDLESQLPADSVETCPVCHSAYEIEKHARHVHARRSAFLRGLEGVTHHENIGADEGDEAGQGPA